MNAAPLWEFVNERHAIYIRKWIREGGFDRAPDAWPHAPEGADLEECDPDHLAMSESGPLTRDPVLARYRFCNVFRELDRVTEWIRRNIREPFADHPDLWLMLAIARTINWPPTLQFIMNRGERRCEFNAWPNDNGQGLPHFTFTPEGLGDALDYWKAQGNKLHTGAYMIRAESRPEREWYSWTKAQYLARIVIGRLWEDRDEWRSYLDQPPVPDSLSGLTPTLHGAWSFFQDTRYVGWGAFMAYQVVVDMRHTRYLRDAPDINTWAALGPGSRRGLNRLAGRPLGYNLSQEEGLAEMLELHAQQDAHRAPWVPRIDLSDIQNCLCETDKLLRARSGEGKPRATYVPGRGS